MLPRYNIRNFCSGGAVFALALSRKHCRLLPACPEFDWRPCQRRRPKKRIAPSVLAAIGQTPARRKAAIQYSTKGCTHVENKIRGRDRGQPDRRVGGFTGSRAVREQ